MNKNKFIYRETQFKTEDYLPWWKELVDENYKLIYREYNREYNNRKQIKFYI